MLSRGVLSKDRVHVDFNYLFMKLNMVKTEGLSNGKKVNPSSAHN